MEWDEKKGEFKLTNPHPAAYSALDYIKKLSVNEISIFKEAVKKEEKENNDLAKICCHTLNRILKGEPASDRYILGLAWVIKNTLGKKGETNNDNIQSN